jgi:hypothetical protein
MSIVFNVDPLVDGGFIDFTMTVQYVSVSQGAIDEVPCLVRAISQSMGRNIEQFDIGGGLTQRDCVFLLGLAALNGVGLTPYDFLLDVSEDQIKKFAGTGNERVFDVIYVERMRCFILAVARDVTGGDGVPL